MLSLILAALLQAAPAAAGETADNGLPKDDYSRVAWCHGALAGQLELDSVAMADMEKIEGKAKAAERRKADAEMLAERRQYLKDYERALAAAEAASPTMIHAKGVAAEQQGYRMWTATRNKAPIWRMLDWGMWDPNDAGCGEAAKRLYEKSSLFGEALKGGATAAKTVDAPPAPPEAEEAKPAEAKPAETVAATAAGEPAEAAPAKTEVVAATTETAPTAEPVPAAPPIKATKRPSKTKTVAKAKAKSAEAVRAAIAEAPPAEASAPPPPSATTDPAPSPPASEPAAVPGLRGPQ